MRWLVSHECSGAIRRALRARGIEAWSNDIQPSEDGGQHIHGPAEEAIRWGWDGIIIHPVCRYVAVSGNRWHAGTPEREAAIERAVFLWNLCRAHADRVCLENPVSVLSRALGRPQTVQPFWFGDPFYKATCLWLHNLPELVPTNKLPEPARGSEEWKRWNAVHRCPPGEDRARERARTFPGIAAAMADQFTRPLPLWRAA